MLNELKIRPAYWCLLCYCLFACKGHDSYSGKPAPVHSFIDNIKSADQIDSLMLDIAEEDYIYRVKKLSETTGRFDSIVKPLAKAKGIDKSYFKADFDSNGYTDLFVNGGWTYKSDDGDVWFDPHVIMNYGDGHYTFTSLKKGELSAFVARPDEKNGTPVIRMEEVKYQTGKVRAAKLVREELNLVYKLGNFVEYNPTPLDDGTRIDRIHFSAGSCMGMCPVYQMIINSDGTACYLAEAYNEKKPDEAHPEKGRGFFKARLRRQDYNKIISLLKYINFSKLQDNYTVSHTCASSSALRITYNEDQVKLISDYGKAGTYGLVALYKMFDELRFSQKWVPAKEPPGIRINPMDYTR